MIRIQSRRLGLAAFLFLAASVVGTAQTTEAEAPTKDPNAKIKNALAEVSEDVRIYDLHINFLASPFLAGRDSAEPGAEIGRQYVEHYLKLAGLKPAFGGTMGKVGADATSYRQEFPLRPSRSITGQTFKVGDKELIAGTDFKGMVVGTADAVKAPVVFAGYGISNSRKEYESFEEGDDFAGKIVMVFRFEPMNAEGTTLWPGRRGGWSARASTNRKIRMVARRNPAGIIIVNPPNCADPRSKTLDGMDTGRKAADCPVIFMTADAAEALVAKSGKSLLELRQMADQGRAIVPLEVEASMKVDIAEKQNLAYNVGGLLPGKGKLKDQVIVVGAHIDHLGLGYFGSREPSARGQIHPGADDNASGTAAILMMADMMSKQYAEMPEGADARTILFVGLDAEERGLIGAGFYTENPIAPLEDHTLMINFDMIGRITDRRVRVDGAKSGEGLDELIRPILEASPLTIVENANGAVMMASDHARFYQKRVPVLFSIIDPFHGDYHTTRDTVDKINRVDAVEVVYLYDKILRAVATHPERMPFKPRAGGNRRNRNR